MMDGITILAETVEKVSETPQLPEEAVVPVDLMWGYITSLNLVEALTFISFGAVCLLYGWRVFKILVVISFALLGLFFGVAATDKISGENHRLLGGLVGLCLAGALSVPLMRWAVSVLGAIAGGIVTSGIWYACGLTETYIWAGALVGIVAGGMISFIIFRIAVMLFSSLAGSSLISVGMLALLYLYPETKEQVQELVFTEKWFLPVVLLAPTVVGLICQNKFVKGSQEWSV
jgi:hypothetical protein